jgi:predicted AAA+ superfamily ATPase
LDTGLACYLSGWRTQEQLVNGARWGHLFETFIVGEIIKSYYNAGVSLLPIYYHRDKNNKDKEIDLVFDIGDTLYPVEIKTSAMPDKSMVANFGLLDAVRGNKKLGEGAVICTYKDPYFFNAENKVIPVDMI